MASAALWPSSAERISLLVVPKRLRAFRNYFFTEEGRPLRLLPLVASTSPKGRGKSTAGNFLIMPNTLVSNLTAWLSLWESWRGSA